MEKDYNRIKETFKKFQNTGDKSEFLEEVSLKILNFSKESNNEEFEEYVSDVFLKFQNQFSNFVNSYHKSKPENLCGFLYLYLKNLFLNEYKYNKNRTSFPLKELYELEEQRQKNDKINSKEN